MPCKNFSTLVSHSAMPPLFPIWVQLWYPPSLRSIKCSGRCSVSSWSYSFSACAKVPSSFWCPDVKGVGGVGSDMVSSLPSPSPTVSPPTPPIFPGISYSETWLLQQSCSEVQNLRQSSAMKIVPVPVSGSKFFCDHVDWCYLFSSPRTNDKSSFWVHQQSFSSW